MITPETIRKLIKVLSETRLHDFLFLVDEKSLLEFKDPVVRIELTYRRIGPETSKIVPIYDILNGCYCPDYKKPLTVLNIYQETLIQKGRIDSNLQQEIERRQSEIHKILFMMNDPDYKSKFNDTLLIILSYI